MYPFLTNNEQEELNTLPRIHRFFLPGPSSIVLVCLYLNLVLEKTTVLDEGQLDAMHAAVMNAL